ncbi:MAG: hypothetical protein ACI4T0_06640 [Candidatus Limisoma sp.]
MSNPTSNFYFPQIGSNIFCPTRQGATVGVNVLGDAGRQPKSNAKPDIDVDGYTRFQGSGQPLFPTPCSLRCQCRTLSDVGARD